MKILCATAILVLLAVTCVRAEPADSAADLRLRDAHEAGLRARKERRADEDRHHLERADLFPDDPKEEPDAIHLQMQRQHEEMIAAAERDGRERLVVHLAQHGVTAAPREAPPLSAVQMVLWAVVCGTPLLYLVGRFVARRKPAAQHLGRAR